MEIRSSRGLVARYEHNPILTKHDVPYLVETVHNAAVVKLGSRYLMVFRSHQRSGRSILGAAESDDGLRFNVRPEPFMAPATSGLFAEAEEYGVEDPRITPLDGRYYITYVVFSCGAVPEPDDTVKLYWGGAPTRSCVSGSRELPIS
jgi:predicted GH43/DUF377 family glycosyl hydrolase